ncbi:hypothetical protein ANOM_006357 [Aspergillus nomiae NRRL 13137]|uniref:Cyanovirin-N domain-containing protein n=1 Tax=Aspergillus nomiae NRRL (strain ATCC 15546 / NRRL 13137 / CBS 260.88 / M93) TaxID=1509407 RepID=A0A0L1J0J5_ASPN3|nr:uncharacterized protein ANOM_006357 [Aspergillus nomiae NRRL 13137]KNG85272.1 hypothetical protein ANOM_006357 [Aspergillus nomiae NRRL 13137]
MHHFIIIITLYLSALVAGGGILSKPKQTPPDEGIPMTDMTSGSSGGISDTNNVNKGALALHDECRYLKVKVTSPEARATASAKDTAKTGKGPTTITTPYRQVLLTADCRRPMSDPKKAHPDGDWRETTLDLDKCVGWNAQTQKLTPESDGKGLMKGDCWNCDYFTQVTGKSAKAEFECYCDSVDNKSKQKIPHSKDKALKVKFDLDAVLWSRDGRLNCHKHMGS